MNGLGHIIATNARAAGKEALAFTVYVIVDPAKMREYAGVADTQAFTTEDMVGIVSDEIEAHLDSNSWVESSTVRRKTT